MTASAPPASRAWRALAAIALLLLVTAAPRPGSGQDATAEVQLDAARAAARTEDADAQRRALSDLTSLYGHPSGEVRAKAYYRAGQLQERLGEYGDALRTYQSAIDADPSARIAHQASRRVRALERQAERGVPTDERRQLDALRRTYDERGSAETMAEIEALLERAEDPQLRIQLLLWLGEELLYVVEDPDEARRHYLQVVEEPGVSGGDAYNAFWGAAMASLDWPAATETLNALDDFVRRHPNRLDDNARKTLRDELVDRRQRIVAGWTSWCALAALFGLFVLRRGWRAFAPHRISHWRPWLPAGFFGVAFVGAALIAERWEHGYIESFLATGAAVLAVVLTAGAARWSEEEPIRGPLRVVAALIVALATLGAVFLTLSAFGHAAVLGM